MGKMTSPSAAPSQMLKQTKMLRVNNNVPIENIVDRLTYGLSVADHVEFVIEKSLTPVHRQIYSMIFAVIASINNMVEAGETSRHIISMCFNICPNAFELYK
jgi:hypothetical protein